MASPATARSRLIRERASQGLDPGDRRQRRARRRPLVRADRRLEYPGSETVAARADPEQRLWPRASRRARGGRRARLAARAEEALEPLFPLLAEQAVVHDVVEPLALAQVLATDAFVQH